MCNLTTRRFFRGSVLFGQPYSAFFLVFLLQNRALLGPSDREEHLSARRSPRLSSPEIRKFRGSVFAHQAVHPRRPLATLSATATHMLFTIAVSFATAFTPSGGLRAFTTRAPGRRRVVLLQTSKDMDEEISLAARVDERWKFLRDNPGMDAAEAADDAKANPMQRSKDKRLAERDTRQWCLDRCLATGYCEVRLACPARTWTRQGLPSGGLILGLVRLRLIPL